MASTTTDDRDLRDGEQQASGRLEAPRFDIIRTDFLARTVLASAYLYYVHDSPILSDADNDAFVKELFLRWNELSDLRKYQFESPEALAASTHHVWLTRYNVDGAAYWYESHYGTKLGPDQSGARWVFNKQFGLKLRRI